MFKVKQGLISIGVIGALLLLATQSFALPFGYSSRENDLYRIDLGNASKTFIGSVGFDDVEALSFNPVTGILYGIDDDNGSGDSESLISINIATGLGTRVKVAGVDSFLGFTVSNPGFAISPSGLGYMSHDPGGLGNDAIYTVDLLTGEATKLGNTGVNGIDGLAFVGDRLYGVSGFSSGSGDFRGVYKLDITSGTSTPGEATLFLANSDFDEHMGLAYDGTGLWAISSDSSIYSINLGTKAVTQSFLFSGSGFEGLAIQPPVIPNPEPSTFLLFGSGLVGLFGWRWQKNKAKMHRL